MSSINRLHDAVKGGDLPALATLLAVDPKLSNARSETDPRGTYPLHVAAEFGQAEAAKLLLEHGADVSLLDSENNAIALSWAAFFGRPAVTKVLIEAGSAREQRNKHGLTPLDCASGGAQGQW
jgi:ankyrin repeat protein